MNILLIEPDYRNKYPPLGLMKISAYHKLKGDKVSFTKGKNKNLMAQDWDRIYITTLFTFYWQKTIDTIKFYSNGIDDKSKVYVGGILATLMYDELLKIDELVGITILKGLLDRKGILGEDDIIVDLVTPDYSMIETSKNEHLKYEYKVQNSYIVSTTKGCVRKCEFCAVKILEPLYLDYIDIKRQIHEIDYYYGVKRDLMLMDNNVLASKSFETIIDDLLHLGFGRGNRSYLSAQNRWLTRHIDFNQGIDARLINKYTMELLSKLEIKPLRIAFDNADKKSIEIYVKAQRMANEYGFRVLSNYVLFNFEDKPEDLYVRLKININLNEEFHNLNSNTKIWSFPMKYMPISGGNCKDRRFIGIYWNAKILRGVQCVLAATHGVVGPKKNFFEHAFGRNLNEFFFILNLPEEYIIHRRLNSDNGNIDNFRNGYSKLSDKEKEDFRNLISTNKFYEEIYLNIENASMKELYKHFLKEEKVCQ